MYKILISYLVMIPSTVLCFFPVKDQLKFSLRKTALIISCTLIITTIIFASIQYYANLDDNTLIAPLFIIYFFAYHHCLTVHYSKSLAIFCTSVALITILTNISDCIRDYVFATSDANIILNPELVQFLLSAIAVALLAHPYLTYGTQVINEAETPGVWYTTVLISAAFFIINMLILPVERRVLSDTFLNIHMLLIFVAMLALWLEMQICFYFIVSGSAEIRNMTERMRLLEMQESQFAAQQRYIKATARVRHDFRQSVQTLAELYEAKDYEALGRYLRQYVESIPGREVTAFCENTALNALLNFYVHIAEQNQIRFQAQIAIPSQLPVSDVDLCNIVGNILENAVIACQKTENRFIQLCILTEEIQLYIVAVNSFDGHIRQKNGKYLSTSRDGEGLGLSSIISTAEKYNGTAQFEHKDKQFFSNVAIPLS